MKSTIKILSFILLFAPIFVDAQGLVPCSGTDCQACDLLKLVQNIIDFLIKTATSIAVLMFMWIGVQMVRGGDEESLKHKELREQLKNTVIGFVLMLGAWLIVDTVMKLFLDNQRFGTWKNIECAPARAVGEVPIGEPTTPVPSPGVPAGKYSATDARSTLANNGISINKSEPATSLEGINKSTVADILAFKKSCNCTVVVTGGTEGVHTSGVYSHANGYKYDLRLTNDVTKYVESNFKKIGVRSDGAMQYQSPTGSIFAKEIKPGVDPHWDVLVK